MMAIRYPASLVMGRVSVESRKEVIYNSLTFAARCPKSDGLCVVASPIACFFG
jgi:hypothetical protein